MTCSYRWQYCVLNRYPAIPQPAFTLAHRYPSRAKQVLPVLSALSRARDRMLSGINKGKPMSRLIKELKFFARKGGGGHKTCHNRIRIAGRLGALLLSLNIQVKSLKNLKAKHVEHYVDARLP
ncbi:phage integrase N-terminal domain-containing protein [Xenorhabdus hominickii]